jgi:hypothetical protein
MTEPRHANVEFANGEWKVWRSFDSLAAAMAAVGKLCEVESRAFEPANTATVTTTATIPPVIPHAVAAAVIRDHVLANDEDVGAPGEPPRCSTGGCDD